MKLSATYAIQQQKSFLAHIKVPNDSRPSTSEFQPEFKSINMFNFSYRSIMNALAYDYKLYGNPTETRGIPEPPVFDRLQGNSGSLQRFTEVVVVKQAKTFKFTSNEASKGKASGTKRKISNIV